MVRALTILRLAPIGFVGAIAVLSALGLAGAWAVAQNATPLGVVAWMLPSVVVGALLTVYGTALLQGALTGTDLETEHQVLWRKGRVMILVFVIFAVTISIAGYAYVRDLGTTVRQQRLDQQTAIVTLKAAAIEKWLVERWIDAQFLAKSVGAMPWNGSNLSSDERSLIELLFAEVLAGNPDRVAVRLLDAGGRVLVEVGEPMGPAGREARSPPTGEPDAAQSRIEEWRAPGGGLRLDFVLPIAPAPGRPALRLVVGIDPAILLWPEVRQWPVESASSSVVVVRREGDAVAFVMPPRHPPRERNWLFAIPLSETGITAVQAVLKGDGLYEALDHRGVPVLSAARRLKGIDWTVIAKTDIAEALTPIDRRTRLVVWLTAGAILVAAATTLGLWRTDRASYAMLRDRHARERQALSRHYEQMMKSARDFIFLLDEDQRIVDANAAAQSTYGYTLDELRNMRASDLRTELARTNLSADWTMGLVTGMPIETVHRRKDGGDFPVEISISRFEIDGRGYFQAFVRDISLRKRLEAEVARMARVQSALRSAAGVLLRATTEVDLFRGMCDALVEVGGYRLANVALANDDPGKTIRFVAIAGYDFGYLDQTRISWGEGPRSKGPTGTAIRTGEVQVNQDFVSNPVMAPWREEALRRGLRSSISLPLNTDGRVIGALTLYSDKPDAFEREEVDFLVQFAADISYGIANMKRQRL